MAASMINLFLSALLVWSSSAHSSKVFSAQIVNTFSILAASIATLANGQLSRLHSMAAAMLIGSPLTYFIWIQYIRALSAANCPPSPQRNHWLVSLAPMYLAGSAWCVLVFSAASPNVKFSQDTCNRLPWMFQYYPIPLMVPSIVFTIPFTLAIALLRCTRQLGPTSFPSEVGKAW